MLELSISTVGCTYVFHTLEVSRADGDRTPSFVAFTDGLSASRSWMTAVQVESGFTDKLSRSLQTAGLTARSYIGRIWAI